MPEQFTWTYDATTGVYKNHFLSNRLLELAALDFKFVPFTKKVENFGKGMGDTVNMFFFKALSIPTSAKLEEDTRIPIDQLQQATNTLSIYEWGRGVQHSRLWELLSKYDPKNVVQDKLKEQCTACMDNAAAAAFKEGKIYFIPTSLTGGTWDTDGTPSTSATYNVTKDHIGVIRDYMANDLHVPFFEGDNYIGLATTKFLRGIKQDRDFERWNQYLRKGDVLYRSEVGRLESTRFIEVTNENALSNSVGTGSVLGEATIFGKDAVARAEVEYPHVRMDPNFQGDFGRTKAAVWYGTVGFGVFFNTANDREARIVTVSSS